MMPLKQGGVPAYEYLDADGLEYILKKTGWSGSSSTNSSGVIDYYPDMRVTHYFPASIVSNEVSSFLPSARFDRGFLYDTPTDFPSYVLAQNYFNGYWESIGSHVSRGSKASNTDYINRWGCYGIKIFPFVPYPLALIWFSEFATGYSWIDSSVSNLRWTKYVYSEVMPNGSMGTYPDASDYRNYTFFSKPPISPISNVGSTYNELLGFRYRRETLSMIVSSMNGWPVYVYSNAYGNSASTIAYHISSFAPSRYDFEFTTYDDSFIHISLAVGAAGTAIYIPSWYDGTTETSMSYLFSEFPKFKAATKEELNEAYSYDSTIYTAGVMGDLVASTKDRYQRADNYIGYNTYAYSQFDWYSFGRRNIFCYGVWFTPKVNGILQLSYSNLHYLMSDGGTFSNASFVYSCVYTQVSAGVRYLLFEPSGVYERSWFSTDNPSKYYLNYTGAVTQATNSIYFWSLPASSTSD